MVKVTLEKINEYQTKLIADGKEVILTDLTAKEKHYSEIKELIITIVLMLIMVFIFTVPFMFSPKEEKYKPDLKTDQGVIIDVDGDGLYYHVE